MLAALGLVLLTAKIGKMQDDLNGLRRDEAYFITNSQQAHRLVSELSGFTLNLNQLQVLRKLARPALSKRDLKVLKKNEKEIKRLIIKRRFGILITHYIQVNDPPAGTDPADLFRHLSDEEMVDKANELEEEALRHIGGIKRRMIDLADRISYWKWIQNWGLAFNALLILMATWALGRADHLRDTAS